VLSVQTALIHLSGALGVPCVVMVPKVPEWRYGAAGETMPWYGSVRLVRERAEGGLASVAPEAWQTLLRAIDERPSPLTAPP
jgi:ADP-heptose:LPS heptosyltransferase